MPRQKPIVRHLWNVSDVVQRVHDRMRRRDVDDRKLARREDAADLTYPAGPFARAPRVVNPEKSAFEEIFAEAPGFLGREHGRADIRHEENGTSAQQRDRSARRPRGVVDGLDRTSLKRRVNSERRMEKLLSAPG